MEIEWISVKDKPLPICQEIIAGLSVNIKGIGIVFACHHIQITDESFIIDAYGDYFDDWQIDDYEFWMPLKKPRVDRRKTN